MAKIVYVADGSWVWEWLRVVVGRDSCGQKETDIRLEGRAQVGRRMA